MDLCRSVLHLFAEEINIIGRMMDAGSSFMNGLQCNCIAFWGGNGQAACIHITSTEDAFSNIGFTWSKCGQNGHA
jgi:hypothetical protein